MNTSRVISRWPLAEKSLRRIIAHPEEWDQSTWGISTECGTAFCLAGWICKLAGAKPIWEMVHTHDLDSGVYLSESFSVKLNLFGDARTTSRMSLRTNELAEELIGLNSDRMEQVGSDYSRRTGKDLPNPWHSGNSLYDILLVFTEYAAADGWTLHPEIVEAFEREKAAQEEGREPTKSADLLRAAGWEEGYDLQHAWLEDAVRAQRDPHANLTSECQDSPPSI